MIVYLLISLLFIYILVKYNKEGFEQSTVFKTFMTDIYDEFYTKIYDEVIHTIPFDTAMIELMAPYFKNSSNNNCLCIGSKTGHIVQLLSGSMQVTGVDKSYEMVKMSEYKYPKNRYVYGDYEASFLFQQNTFTHILCPLFTIYTTPLASLFQNANIWLVHQGYMGIMHFKDGFNITNIQNHFQSQYFKLNYTYNISLNNNRITEKITNKKNQVRTNIQYLNEINLEETAKESGFRKLAEYPIPDLPFAFVTIFQKF